MRKHTLLTLLVGFALAQTASATMVRQEWWHDGTNTRQGIIDYLVDLANPVPTPDLEEIQDTSAFSGSRDQYIAKFYGWVTVPETGTYQFHYACDDYGMLYVSQDEEMGNAVEVAYVDGWTNIAEWTKYDSQHSDPMELKAGQVMAVMAFFNEEGGGDNMDIGWTGPGLSSDIYNPTYLTDYITAIPPTPTKAKNPIPETGATDVPRDSQLSWTPGRFAATHDVYLGTNLDDVNNASRDNPMGVLVSQGQAAVTYDPGIMEFATTYYWRIDEVNAAPDNTIYKGKIWQFEVEPFAYPAEDIVITTNAISEEGAGIENIINGSGLNAAGQHSINATDMWLGSPAGADPIVIDVEFPQVYKLDEMLVWNYNVQFELMLGFGCKDVTVEYSKDGVDWTVLGDVVFAQATAKATYEANTTVDFGGAPVKYVRLTINSGYGPLGQFGLSELQFMYVPAHPREPQPINEAVDVDVKTGLAWRAGREAVVHDVYLSTSGEAVLDGTALVDTVSTASYMPSDLEFGTDYYWRIDEVNEADAITTWEGNLWTFRVQDYALIDGFEAYDDEDNRIYDTWLDGWVNDTGSTVGYLEAPFAEKTVVHSGSQSLPLIYDNSASPFYSETERDLGGMNLTNGGADRLIVYYRGYPVGFLENADGSISMGAIGTDIWDTSDEFRFAYKRLSGDGSITVRVDSLVRSDAWAKAGVMIRESLTATSTHATTVVTPDNGVSFQRRVTAGAASTDTTEAGPVAPYWVRITRTGDVFTAQQSADGATWSDIEATSPVTIDMATDVYIGLALTSHNANQMTAAEFSELSTTGTVTGEWQTAAIGVDQPSNDPAPVYMALEDSAGHVAVVSAGNANASTATTWQAWEIPYSDLAGVNFGNVATIYIGVGDRDNPTADGSGILFVDDIGYGRPFVSPADVTAPGDSVQGVPNDGDWPDAETPDLAIDDDVNTKYLHFKGDFDPDAGPTGIQVTPAVGPTLVTGLTFTSANDVPGRDPIAFELYGSKDSIDGPYTLIAAGDIVDFAGATEWPRFTKTTTPITFGNVTAYSHYQVLFTAIRGPVGGSVNSMQIAEIELLGKVAP